MIAKHIYLRYAQALLQSEYNLNNCNDITINHIKSKLEEGLEFFRIEPSESIAGKSSVKYKYCSKEKGDTKLGIYLSPHVITTDRAAKNTLKAVSDLLKLSDENASTYNDINMSIVPITGEYLTFSKSGVIGRGKPKATLIERGLGAITTLTPYKPSLQFKIFKKGKPDMFNICLLPDLPIEELIDFISLFKRMLMSQSSSDLMTGNIVLENSGSYLPKRPLIFKGNFPNPPRSSVLGPIALLGAIGEFAKEAEYSEQAERVLESLKNTQIYLIKYGEASVFTYNHHVIDLAKAGKLKTIIDSLYYSELYNQSKRSNLNSEYQKFDLFTSRFLQLFNSSAFRDFLSFRAEYPNEITTLLIIYFTKMEKIELEIVQSARILGKWLNMVAYFYAKNDVKEGTPNYWEEIRKTKAKVLVELESSTFSSKSGDALLAQTITRAGRLSGMDAPEGATLYMEKTASGDLPLEVAKNLLIAFSRLMNNSESKEKTDVGMETELENEEDLTNE
jgi:CRISPR-associated protein Cas8c/Csp2